MSKNPNPPSEFQYWNVSGKIIVSESAAGAKRIAKGIHGIKGSLRARLATAAEIAEYSARQAASRTAYAEQTQKRLADAGPVMLAVLQEIYAQNKDFYRLSAQGITAERAQAAIAAAGPRGLNQGQEKEVIAILARELRRCIARWAKNADAGEWEALGETLVPLAYDLEELRSGNYDPAQALAADEQAGTTDEESDGK